MKKIISLIIITQFLFIPGCKDQAHQPTNGITNPTENISFKKILTGRYILRDAKDAGFVFNSKTDTLKWIDETDPLHPTDFRIEWISDNVFTYSDFQSTEAGVARMYLCSILKLSDKELIVIEHFSGLCNIEPNKDISGNKNDTLVFKKTEE